MIMRRLLAISGIVSGYISVLLYCLYINFSPNAVAFYQRPKVLWLVCPFLIYWITRIWLFAYQGRLDSDPVIFVIKDRVSFFILFVSLFFWGVAKGSFLD